MKSSYRDISGGGGMSSDKWNVSCMARSTWSTDERASGMLYCAPFRCCPAQTILLGRKVDNRRSSLKDSGRDIEVGRPPQLGVTICLSDNNKSIGAGLSGEREAGGEGAPRRIRFGTRVQARTGRYKFGIRVCVRIYPRLLGYIESARCQRGGTR